MSAGACLRKTDRVGRREPTRHLLPPTYPGTFSGQNSASMTTDYAVAILGGGLAGGTLARQFRLEAPHVRVLVVEKRPHPVREAAHKVGESSVEIGAHYF